MNLYLIFKGYKGHYEPKPKVLAYTKKAYRSEIDALYKKYSKDCIDMKIIEAESADSAISIYNLCCKNEPQKYKQMEFDL